MALRRPIRSLRQALRYCWPKRLTLAHGPRIYAWLWWNYQLPTVACRVCGCTEPEECGVYCTDHDAYFTSAHERRNR